MNENEWKLFWCNFVHLFFSKSERTIGRNVITVIKKMSFRLFKLDLWLLARSDSSSPFPSQWDGPTATYESCDVQTSTVSRRKSGVFPSPTKNQTGYLVFLSSHRQTQFKHYSFVTGAAERGYEQRWLFPSVRPMYRWTELPWADRQFPQRATLTSTRKSWKILQRNTVKSHRCLCTHPGRFGWTGKYKSMFLCQFKARGSNM